MHRLVLEGREPGLAAFYPSVGGSWDLDGAWPAFEAVLRERSGHVREWLDRPPQTNEVGRAAALMGGLLRIGESHRLPLRILEIGSSGGLNLRADAFAYSADDGTTQGPVDSPLHLTGVWRGAPLTPWPDLRVVERTGSDPMPVDVRSPAGRLTLTAYVWPDQALRLERLDRAFTVAAQVPAEVRAQDAVPFLDDVEPVEGTTTVLWHSLMWQYLSPEERAAVTARLETIGAAARDTSPFAHLSLEPVRRTPGSDHEFLVVLRLWPAGERRVLGTSAPHGIPTIWE